MRIPRIAFLSTALLACISIAASAGSGRPTALPPHRPASSIVRLTILHTNDTHGHLRPYSYPDTFDSTSPLAKLAARRSIGGIARRATLIRRIRNRSAREGRRVLVIDAGDVCDGTPFSTE